MTKAIRIHQPGGPEAMIWEDVDVGQPGPGQARVRHSAVGLNYIDVYQRMGMYPMGDLPAVIGMEGSGVIEALGEGAPDDLAVGMRVAYADNPPGAYAEARVMPADRLVPVPDGISDETAAAMMLQGMTAEYLLRRTYEVLSGDTILFHAAAGGVGLIACQWAKYLGATVIGTVGTEEKAELAKAHGCDHTIVYTRENFVDRVKEITDGAGLPVVYDSVGKDTFVDSMSCLRPRGLAVNFGNASGPADPVSPGDLAKMGCLYMTRPSLMVYNAKREDLLASAKALFDVVLGGQVKIEINQTYALSDAAQAHTDLEGRKTTGSTVFTV